MKSKKASAMIIVMVIIGIAILASIIFVGVYVANQNGLFNNNPKVSAGSITLYLQAEDKDSLISQDASYVISHPSNGTDIIDTQGSLKSDSFTPIVLPNNQSYRISCFNDDHYLVSLYPYFSAEEITANKSKRFCDMPKIGNLQIDHQGDLRGQLNNIQLNVTCKDGYCYKLGVCYSWTAGIINVGLTNSLLTCQNGVWSNYSSFDPHTEKFNWLPNGTYVCGTDDYEQCEYVDGNRCKIKDMEVPSRLKNTVDGCSFLGISLENNQSTLINLEVKTEDYKNRLDEVNFYLIDSDRRYDPQARLFNWLNQDSQGEDIAMKDFKYSITYTP